MKRILLSVFAAAVAAAWSMPADAADVTFSGQYRLRGELRNNLDFEDSTKDASSFIGQRVRLTANAKATDDTSIKITLQDTRNWGAAQASAGGPNLTDDGSNGLDFHESYVNIENLFGAPVSLRAGRQELSYGDERLIGAFNWSNNGRSFDAFKLMYKSTPADVDFFASKVREASSATVGGNDNDQDFYGLYATVKVIPNNTLDLYALLLRDGRSGTVASPQNPFGFTGGIVGNTTVIGAGTTVDNAQTLWTYGARLKGSVAGLDYTAEIPFQTGDFKTFDGTNKKDYSISGYAYAVKVGYTLPTALKLRVGAEYDFASGDDNAGSASPNQDTDIQTFFNLFPTNHDKLGYMDLQGWRNVQAWSVNARLDVNEKLAVYAAYWDFKLAEKNDAWYAAGDWNTAPTTSNLRLNNNSLTAGVEKDDDVGSEIDLVATYKYNNAVTAEVGYSRFFTGGVADAYFRNTATTTDSSADQDWAYLQITANF